MSLSEAQTEALNKAKVALRLENEKYLRQHPELRGMISLFMAKVLEGKPEDVQQYAAEFFTQEDLEPKVRESMEVVTFKPT